MTKNYSVRTDLALEERERFESDQVEISGVILEEDYDESSETRITRVIIETENGAKAMGKPAGTYLTLESPALAVPDEEEQMRISEKIRDCISELLRKNFEAKEGKEEEDLSILVVGLGNRNITPDALGPCVADHLNVTRHIIREYGKYAMGVEHAKLVSAIVPGVMGQTGMETTEIVRGIVRETRPDLVIAVDALAARNSRRLNRTIQIADTGIHPGSGVGNYRNGMTKESLGVPVIGIGVPTVVDAATIVNDTMENFIHALEESETLKSVGETLRSYNQGEKYELVKELINKARNLDGLEKFSEKSVEADGEALLRMYVRKPERGSDPEEKNISPFGIFELVKQKGSLYWKSQPPLHLLPAEIVGYLLKDCTSKEGAVSIDDLLTGKDSPGRILNLKRTGLVEKLEELEQKNYIQMNRTAGLDMVYLNQSVTGEEIVKKYFRP